MDFETEDEYLEAEADALKEREEREVLETIEYEKDYEF